ncbi:MAG: response regulator transcription factor [Armatimonadetes bacterium]|jgi:DNA-binding NarL/FixJ family response regulator|nr:response regulator transcription factor [Armatimonadota bacterium]
MHVFICVGDSFGARGLELLLNQLCPGAQVERVANPEEALERCSGGDGTVVVTSLAGAPEGMDDVDRLLVHSALRVLVLAPAGTPASTLLRCVGSGRGFVMDGAHPDLLRQAVEAIARGKSFADPTLFCSLFDALKAQRNSAAAISYIDPDGVLPARIRRAVIPAAQGYSDKEIARRLRLSEATVRGYLHEAYELMGVSGRRELTQRYQDGLRGNTTRRDRPTVPPARPPQKPLSAARAR